MASFLKKIKKLFITNTDKRPCWILLGILGILLKTITTYFPSFIEKFYSNILFKGIRFVLDNTIGQFNFPFLILVFLFLIYFIIRIFITNINKELKFIYRILNGFYSLFASILWIIFWFTILWGLNYNRPPIESKIKLATIPISSDYLKDELIKRERLLIE